MTGRKPRAKDGAKLRQPDDPRWLVMVPWLAIDTLNVYDLAVLIHIKRITLEHGECFTSNKTLAQKIGCSVTQLKKSRSSLEAKGFIAVEHERNDAGIVNTPPTITPVNVWSKNNAIYDKLTKKQGENPGHQVTTPSHTVTTRRRSKTAPRSPRDTKENIQEESFTDASASDAPSTVPVASVNGKVKDVSATPKASGKRAKPKDAPRGELDKRDALYEAVELHIFGVQGTDGDPYLWTQPVGGITQWLRGRIHNYQKQPLMDNPKIEVTPEMIVEFVRRYRAKYTVAIPTKVDKFINHWIQLMPHTRGVNGATASSAYRPMMPAEIEI
jgi:hypothetical protein